MARNELRTSSASMVWGDSPKLVIIPYYHELIRVLNRGISGPGESAPSAGFPIGRPLPAAWACMARHLVGGGDRGAQGGHGTSLTVRSTENLFRRLVG